VDFALFIIVTAILFIRPTDFIPGLEQFPLYLIAIVPCILLSWHKLIPQLTIAGLQKRPILVFGIGIMLVGAISSLVHSGFEIGWLFVADFAKMLTFYVLMLAQLDSPRRIRSFLACLVAVILVPVVLAVLNYHEYIDISAFNPMNDLVAGGPKAPPEAGAQAKDLAELRARAQEPDEVKRLGATGNFRDPNDVCEIVNCALIFSLYGLLNRSGGCLRIFWLGPIALLGHALGLTYSRGGFLAFLFGLMVLLWYYFGTKKALIAAGLALPLILVLFVGRQTSIDVRGGTGQTRIQLWDDGFQRMRESPVIGVGLGGFIVASSHAAHNAFISVYAELGLLAGTFLVGQYFWCLTNLAKLGSKRVTLPDPEVRGLQPFVTASLASFAASEMSLTNSMHIVSYAMFGLASAFIQVAAPIPPLPDLLLSNKLVGRILVFSSLFLVGLYVFVKVMVRY